MTAIATKENEARQVSLSQAVGEIDWENRLVPLTQLPQTFGPLPTKRMIGSVRDIGILTPILLRDNRADGSDACYEVLDGMRRISAAREAGLTEIPARVAVGPHSGNAILTLIANEQRSTNPVSEYRSITQLIADQFSETEIARLTAMPVQTIRKRMRIRQLTSSWFALFENGDLPTALAEELAKLPEGEQRETYQRWCDGERLTHALLQDVRSVRREAAVMDLLPGLGELGEVDDEPNADATRDRALALIERIRMELVKAGNPGVMQAIDRLLGELEAELNRGGWE